MKTIAIFGSSSSQGKTRDFIDEAIKGRDIELIDLKKLDISHFDYEHKNKNDDFINIIEKILEVDHIILVTPVYWYTMSSYMKVFLDRITDLIIFYPEKYNKLKGKRLSVVTTFGSSKPEGFEYPFSQTCNYIGMDYKGCSYFYTGDKEDLLRQNVDILSALKNKISK